jgi:ribosomal protein S18 acetylase RimI-like enzyme
MKYIIYKLFGTQYPITVKPADIYAYVWQPSFSSIHPSDLTGKYLYWGLAYLFKLLGRHNYRVLYLINGTKVVHRSVIMPKYFRWPFMKKEDLQVSSTWTDPAYRNRGYATYALILISQLYSKPGRSIFYTTRENNIASIKVCTSAGFQKYSYVVRTNFLGIPLFGKLIEENRKPEGGFKKYSHYLAKNHYAREEKTPRRLQLHSTN